MKSNLKFQQQIIQDQRELIRALEQNPQSSQGPLMRTSIHCDCSDTFDNRTQQVFKSLEPQQDMMSSALYQHPAMIQHPVLEDVLQHNAHLQNSVQFNDILTKAQLNVEQAFLIKGGTIVPIIDGQD